MLLTVVCRLLYCRILLLPKPPTTARHKTVLYPPVVNPQFMLTRAIKLFLHDSTVPKVLQTAHLQRKSSRRCFRRTVPKNRTLSSLLKLSSSCIRRWLWTPSLVPNSTASLSHGWRGSNLASLPPIPCHCIVTALSACTCILVLFLSLRADIILVLGKLN